MLDEVDKAICTLQARRAEIKQSGKGRYAMPASANAELLYLENQLSSRWWEKASSERIAVWGLLADRARIYYWNFRDEIAPIMPPGMPQSIWRPHLFKILTDWLDHVYLEGYAPESKARLGCLPGTPDRLTVDECMRRRIVTVSAAWRHQPTPRGPVPPWTSALDTGERFLEQRPMLLFATLWWLGDMEGLPEHIKVKGAQKYSQACEHWRDEAAKRDQLAEAEKAKAERLFEEERQRKRKEAKARARMAEEEKAAREKVERILAEQKAKEEWKRKVEAEKAKAEQEAKARRDAAANKRLRLAKAGGSTEAEVGLVVPFDASAPIKRIEKARMHFLMVEADEQRGVGMAGGLAWSDHLDGDIDHGFCGRGTQDAYDAMWGLVAREAGRHGMFDVDGALIGYRGYGLGADAGVLLSGVRGTPWPEPYLLADKWPSNAHQIRNTHGIHGCWSPFAKGMYGIVHAEVRGYGRWVYGLEGWRAEECVIVGLRLTPACPVQVERALRMRYGVPITREPMMPPAFGDYSIGEPPAPAAPADPTPTLELYESAAPSQPKTQPPKNEPDLRFALLELD